VSLEYSNAWDPLADGRNGLGFSFSQEYLKNYWFNMEDVESATQYFSEVNLLGKSKFSSVYKGVLRDGSLVAVKSINVTSCKSEEAEFLKGLHLLFSLRHENLVKLKGFCCSRGRGECFLIYDFVPNGNLSQYLDVEDGRNQVLDWSKRVSIISGIAKGNLSSLDFCIHYLILIKSCSMLLFTSLYLHWNFVFIIFILLSPKLLKAEFQV
jgi:serine/threonine protein kinase